MFASQLFGIKQYHFIINLVIYKMVYNLQSLSCVQEVAGYPGKRSAVAKRTPNTKADANGYGLVGGPGVVNVLGPDGSILASGHGLVGVHGKTPGVVNVVGPDGSILFGGHGLVFVHGRTADVVAPGIGRPLNLARPVVQKRKIR